MAGSQFLPQFLHQSYSVLLGHHNIADYDIGHILNGFLQSFHSVGSFYNTETLAENAPQEEAQLQIVFYEQHCLCFRNRCLVSLISSRNSFRLILRYSNDRSFDIHRQGMLGCFTDYFHVIRQDKFGILTVMVFSLQEVYAKATAFSFLTVYMYAGMVHFHQFFHKRKSDARTVRIEQVLIEQGFKTYKQ